jgi:hypothetical protein
MDVTVENQAASSAGNGAQKESNNGSLELTPELVRQVADKVYALLLKELRIEQERRRPR